MAVGASWPLAVTSSTPTRLQILNLTFLTTLQVSEYVRISTNSHDALETRGGCWLIDERMGAGDVGEDKPMETGFTSIFIYRERFPHTLSPVIKPPDLNSNNTSKQSDVRNINRRAG